jgi:hypothetical protein
MAAAFARQNPAEYDAVIGRFQEVLEKARGTDYATKATAEIRRVEGERDKAVAALLSNLRQRAEVLARQGQARQAAALLRSYNGPLAARTRDERLKEAAAIESSPDFRPPVPPPFDAAAMVAASAKQYETLWQENAQRYDGQADRLNDQYAQNLASLADQARKMGDRNGLRQFEAERTRFLREKTVPPKTPKAMPNVMRQLQDDYRTSRARLDLSRSRSAVMLVDNLDANLAHMEQGFLGSNQTNALAAVRSLRNRLQTEPEIKKARETVKAGEEKKAK